MIACPQKGRVATVAARRLQEIEVGIGMKWNTGCAGGCTLGVD